MIRAFSALQVREAEAPLLAAGVPLMRQAARAVALAAVRAIREAGQRVPGSAVLALVGGGNNGGDALWAAADLARRGVQVHAALCAPAVHAEGLAGALAAGVRPVTVLRDGGVDTEALLRAARRAGVWIDGLAGIGLTGPLRDPLATVVRLLADERAASPDEPVVVAVDVPSGLGDGGAVPGPILPADVTVTMGAPKGCLLLPPANHLAGRVEVVELGLEFGPQAGVARSLTGADVADLYPWPRHSDHKYTRGVAGIWAGSQPYPGAARLACAGALAAGPGMVRYLGGAPLPLPEVVGAPGRIQSALVGSGIADAAAARAALREALAHGVPVVVDAGALTAFDDVRSGAVILTPHAGELAALAGVERARIEADPAAAAQAWADARDVVVLLKGPTTVVALPGGMPWSQSGSTPWLATAGSGDVLAGLLTGLLALVAARAEEPLDREDLARCAAAASWLHSRAGLRAARHGVPITAGRVAAALPAVIAGLD